MRKKELEDLAAAVKTVFGYKPKDRYHRPDNKPSAAEMNRRFRIDTPPPPKK